VGSRPFESESLRSSGFDQMRRIIREQDPKRPSTRARTLGEALTTAAEQRRTDPANLVRMLRGDLDWITMRALEKDRTRRYGSPGELAADIERHLHNEPVFASPPSTFYRAQKFVRRNRAAVAAGALVVAALVLGIIGTSLGLLRARREAVAARRVSDVLVSMYADLNPSLRAGTATSREEMLDRAVTRIEVELKDEPLVQARMMVALGDAYKELGMYDRARPLFEESAELRRYHLGESHPDYAMTISFLGDLLSMTGDFQGARRLHERALAIRREVLGPDHVTVGWSLRSLGETCRETGELDRADTLYRQSLEIISKAVGEDHPDVATTLYLQARLAWQMGDLETARRFFQRSLEIRERTLGSVHPDVGDTLLEYGRLLYLLGDGERSREFTKRSAEIFRHVYGSGHHQTASPIGQLAVLEFLDGNVDEARSLYRQILEIQRATGAPVLDELRGYPEFVSMVEAIRPPDGGG
jgi:tetratricopeptide (TPR) repeat protein